ncbi:MAG TPA: OB-fold nucleic acid binding domain-containing protein, partial [Chitinophagaceae bacterium]|nr:OB-fold nucleic acid binding domain-containing protein [Chitinophagaceae bacterium]
MHLSEQEIIRREKLAHLKNIGIDAYPAAAFPVTHYSDTARQQYEAQPGEKLNVTLAGRIMSINDKGKVFFFKIQDAGGLMQLYVKKDEVCPGEDKTLFDEVIKKSDLGDIIGCSGYMFTTKTGEISLHVSSFTLLAKSLKPLPVVKRDEEGHVFDEVSDPEFRYRQRYADLIIHPE